MLRCTKLICGHRFHRKCIEQNRRDATLKCPNCAKLGLVKGEYERVASRDEQFLHRSVEDVVDANIRDEYIFALTEEALRRSDSNTIRSLRSHVQFNRVIKAIVCRFIQCSDVKSLQKIQSLIPSFNWHATVCGMSLYEHAVASNADEKVLRLLRPEVKLYPSLLH